MPQRPMDRMSVGINAHLGSDHSPMSSLLAAQTSLTLQLKIFGQTVHKLQYSLNLMPTVSHLMDLYNNMP